MMQAPHNFSAPFAQSPVPASVGQFPSPQTATSGLPQSVAPNMTSLSASSTPGAKPGTASPGAAAGPPAGAGSPQEKARVSILLEINSSLLQEVQNLQNAGKAGTTGQQGQDSTDQSDASKQEYLECMRRLQSNLGYLANIADRGKKTGGVPPSAPSITTPPPNMPALNEPYARLNELCPRGSHRGTPQPNSQGNGKSSPSIPESVV